jgi:hypothetical protein
MSWFHIDQRAVRARCGAILARVPATDDLGDEARHEVTRIELLQVLEGARLVPGATARGVASLLLEVRRSGGDWRRTIERGVSQRGAVRRERAAAAGIVIALALIGLAWILPWLLAVPPAIAYGLFRRWTRAGEGAVHVHRMEHRARAADQADDVETVNALYAEARRMIAEDRVPRRVGFRLAHVLEAAAHATPFPTDLLRELRQLRTIAPETELTYDHARETIEGRLALRRDESKS